jgi:hypothetical protein
MKRNEFLAVMHYIAEGCGKSLSEGALEVYFDLLADLPLPALQAAAKLALSESRYPVFPPVGTLRVLATESLQGKVAGELVPAEAWRRACRAADVLSRRADFINGETGAVVRERTLAELPASVREAGEAIGWYAIANTDNVETTRAHFQRAYEALVLRKGRERLLSPDLRARLEAVVAATRLPAAEKPPALAIAGRIGTPA